MFSLFKKSGSSNNGVPEWASFFDSKEYAHFTYAVRKYFDNLSIEVQLDDGVLLPAENLFGFNKLGLVNVAQNCKQSDIKEYQVVVDAHFNSIKDTFEFDQKFKMIENDFEQISSYL